MSRVSLRETNLLLRNRRRLGLALAFAVVVAGFAISEAVAAQTEGDDPVGDQFFSGLIDGPDYCLDLSSGGAQTYPFDSDGDGVADTCSLQTTRREAVARQNAKATLARKYGARFAELVEQACQELGSAEYDDDASDLESDVCATGELAELPSPPATNEEQYWSGTIDSPDFCDNLGSGGAQNYPYDSDNDGVADVCGTEDVPEVPLPPPSGYQRYWSGMIPSADFCTNLSFGGAQTYPYDSDGDGVADICALPFTRREAVARQNAYEALKQEFSGSFLRLLDVTCASLRDTQSYFGDDQPDLDIDACAPGTVNAPYDAPPPPGKPDAPTLQVGIRLLVADWVEPSNSGPAINDYDVRHCDTSNNNVCDDDNSDDEDWIELPDTGDDAADTATTITITGLANGTTYEVQVRAGSSAGNGPWSDSATATVANVPDKPAAPSLTPGAKQLEVSWTAPNNEGPPISDYDVRYKVSSDSNWSDWTHTGTGTTATITGLANNTAYQVQVRATNGAGTGIWSNSASATSADVPSKPGAPTLTPGHQQLGVEWSAPAANRAAITDYDVQYRECTATGNTPCNTTGNWTDITHTGTATTATITSLTNGTTYQVQVRATNGAGTGAWSDSKTGTSAGEPSTPYSPILHSGTSTELTVYWWAPADNGASINDYDVRYCDNSTGCDADSEWTEFNASDTSTATTATLTGLTDDTTYQVQVRAGNSTGDSSWSSSASQTASSTAPTRPDAPTGLTVTASASQRLTLSWTAPADDKGSTVIGYQFFACYPWSPCTLDEPTSPRPWPRTSPVEPTCHSAAHSGLYASSPVTLTGLTNGFSYWLQVRAKNLMGCSDWSSSTTGTPTLAPPTNLVLTAYQDGVSASWTAPIGSITGYDVQYQACTATPKTCTSSPTWGSWTNHSHSGTSARATITGLTYGTAYKVQVRAKSGSTTTDWLTSTSSAIPAKSKPDAPAKPTLVSGNAQLKVDWSAPTYNGGSAITDYDVQYKASSASDWTDFTHTGTATTATITQLTNGTTYYVQVRAVNDYNDDSTADPGAWSSSAAEKTGKPAKMAAPSLTSGTSSLVVSWPPATDNGSTITGYRLRYQQVGKASSKTSSWFSGSTTTTKITTDIDGTLLDNGSSYTVQIQTRNANGESVWSDTATEKVGKPGKVRINSLGEHRYTESGSTKVGFSASWQKPAHPSESGFGISGYEMQYRKADATTWQNVTGITMNNSGGGVTVKPTSPSFVTVYELRLRAQNSAGYSPWTERMVIVWPPPAAPTNVKFIAGDKHLRLEWTPPSDHGKGRVTAYYAEYRTAAVGNTPAGQWQTFNGLLCVENRHDVDLDNLSLKSTDQMGITNGTKYDVRIQAINRATNTAVDSYSPWSTVASVTAGSGKPWPPYWQYEAWTTPDFFPGNYPTVTRGDTQLTVTWYWPHQNVAPNNGGSAVTDYDVRYKTTSGGTWTEWNASDTSTTTTATITGLTNGTGYDVQIRAGNSNGDGDWTPSFPGTPSTSAPTTPAAPTGVNVLSGSLNPLACGGGSGKLTVVGLTLPSDNGGATVDHLQVRYRETGTNDDWTELSDTQIVYSFTPPKQGTSYDVQVRLKNSVGWGAWSSTVTQTSNKPLPATMVNAAPGNTQLYVRAGAGHANGSTTTGYQLRYRAASATDWTTDTTIRTGEITTITGLINGTKYEVQARTTSNNGNSEWSSSAFATPAAP